MWAETSIHAEKRAPHVDHLSRQEGREPRKAYDIRCAGAENSIAAVAVIFIATLAKGAVAEA